MGTVMYLSASHPRLALNYFDSISVGTASNINTLYHQNSHELYIQGDQKVSVHIMITIQKVTSNVQTHTSFLPHYLAQSDFLAADRQGQGGTRLALTPSVIPNFNYVIIAND
jgi:hypothetical protein